MPGLKEVKNKIEGVSKTSQITKAMNMVASAKLRGAQLRMEAFRPYAGKFAEAMQKLSGGAGSGQPLMEAHEVKNIELVVITSDRGLCGSFNANVISKTQKLIAQYESEGKKVTLVTVGNKATRAFKRSGKVRRSVMDIMGTFQMFNAREIAEDAAQQFLSKTVDQVELVYARFKSLAAQVPTQETLLPISPAEKDEAEEANPVEYIFEPTPAEIMETLLPLYLNVQVFHAMLEVGAGEQAARMTAMDNATTACGDMIKELKQLYNKARQAAITGDLMDIVGGAEALKG
ncbi:ATP synthase F1 subunit gamma [Candidatus Electronema sp. PJ]|uniref:ATP synthase F1 subunit gamma n=1 Tax=Candidatus Electronema sp. PJ TaxID=3401572 RepID=UPI003AA8897D